MSVSRLHLEHDHGKSAMAVRHVLLPAIVAALFSCDQSPLPVNDGRDNPTPGRGTLEVVVSGTVMDARGSAVSDAKVLLTATHPQLPGPGFDACEGSVLSDVDGLEIEQGADGAFERLVQTTAAGVTAFTGCLVFDVQHEGDGWRFSGIPAEFRLAGIPPDTVAVELLLE